MILSSVNNLLVVQLEKRQKKGEVLELNQLEKIKRRKAEEDALKGAEGAFQTAMHLATPQIREKVSCPSGKVF